jgi:methyltransferase-like protein
VKGKILKVIIFTLEEDGKWNLGFGDWENNNVDDKVMTNNQDVVKVIGTVAKVTYEFFDNYPNAIVVIKPVDEKRKKLYNIVFQRHYDAIKEDFHILTLKDDRIEVYSPAQSYDSFELFLKSK